jgi:DnaJ family protein C protein 7
LYSLNKSIKYNPKYAKALVKRGDMHIALKDYSDAIRDFSEATEYDSNGFNVVAKLKDAQEKAKKAKRKDYYKILGVSKDS